MKLSEDQRKELETELRKLQDSLPRKIQMPYRLVAVPAREGFREIDLGVPTVGDKRGIAAVAYDRLRAEQELIESVAPTILQAKYLRDRDHVPTAAIFEAALRTPGEPRWANREVVVEGIARGVREGAFGLGEVVDGKLVVRAFRAPATPTLAEGEVIVRRELAMALVAGAGKEDRDQREAGREEKESDKDLP